MWDEPITRWFQSQRLLCWRPVRLESVTESEKKQGEEDEDDDYDYESEKEKEKEKASVNLWLGYTTEQVSMETEKNEDARKAGILFICLSWEGEKKAKKG